MQGSRRTERVNVLLRQYISEIIARDMKDPRLASIITIVRVGASKDFRHAKVYTSVMADSLESSSTIETLNSASGFIRRGLLPRLSMKNVPYLNFVLDNSIEKGNELLSKISEVISHESGDKVVE